MNLYEFAHHPGFCGDRYADPSWDAHRVIWRLFDGDADKLNDAQKEIAYELLGCRRLPTVAPAEIFIGAGRRCGKTSDNALFAVYAAAQHYHSPDGPLSTGQWATTACLCPFRLQAKEWLDACKGIIYDSPFLKDEVITDNDDTVEFSHHTRLTVLSSNFRAVRSYTLAMLIMDEAAFLTDTDSAQPDTEIYQHGRAGLRTLRGKLIVTSSHHRMSGLVYDKYCQFYGKVA